MTDDKLTIVGPEPTSPQSKTLQKRVNIEALLLMAKYDEAFKKKLFDDRDKALLESGIDFTPGEKLLLNNISDKQLEENIKAFRIPGITKKSLPNWIIPNVPDPITGQQSWMDTVVKVTKA